MLVRLPSVVNFEFHSRYFHFSFKTVSQWIVSQLLCSLQILITRVDGEGPGMGTKWDETLACGKLSFQRHFCMIMLCVSWDEVFIIFPNHTRRLSVWKRFMMELSKKFMSACKRKQRKSLLYLFNYREIKEDNVVGAKGRHGLTLLNHHILNIKHELESLVRQPDKLFHITEHFIKFTEVFIGNIFDKKLPRKFFRWKIIQRWFLSILYRVITILAKNMRNFCSLI